MKILLTGADGQLGFELWRSLQHIGEVIPTTQYGIEILGLPTLPLDLANPSDIEKKTNAIQPDLIVNPAAYTAVDKAEEDAELAQLINTDAPAIFAKYAVISDTRLVHFSTDYVFDGENDIPWQETDACNPQGVYGQTKLDGELAINDSGCSHMIFRSAWIFSYRAQNFVKSMLKLAQSKDELGIVDDQIGSPTSAQSLAFATLMALQNPQDGLYHMTSAGKTSWCGFARKIFSIAHKLDLIDKIPTVNAISSEQYPTAAKRPTYSVLDCRKIKDTFNITMPNWQTSLQLCMQNFRRES